MSATDLEILIPACGAVADFRLTIASLASQTDRKFSVLLGEPFLYRRDNSVEAAQRLLESAWISVRRVKPPFEMKPIERLNWLHAQAKGSWLKLLLPGEQLKPAYVERLKGPLSEKPKAHLVRCDAALETEWGMEMLRAPFHESAVRPRDVLDFFPAQAEWLTRSVSFACSRVSWLAMGGYSPHLPNNAALQLNTLLALHYGVENIGETLVSAELGKGIFLNGNRGGWVNHWLEWWLILRQAKNFCQAAKLPWPEENLFVKGLTTVPGCW